MCLPEMYAQTIVPWTPTFNRLKLISPPPFRLIYMEGLALFRWRQSTPNLCTGAYRYCVRFFTERDSDPKTRLVRALKIRSG
jgi:hypothetical protein